MKDIKIGTVIQNRQGNQFTVIGFELRWDIMHEAYRTMMSVVNHCVGHCIAVIPVDEITADFVGDEPRLKMATTGPASDLLKEAIRCGARVKLEFGELPNLMHVFFSIGTKSVILDDVEIVERCLFDANYIVLDDGLHSRTFISELSDG